MLSSSIQSAFRILFIGLLFLFTTSIAMGATFSASPSPSTTGNFLISWSGANSGLPQLSEIVGTTKTTLKVGGASGTFQVTGKPAGRYQYELAQITPGSGSGQGAPAQTIFVDVIGGSVSVNVDRSLFVHDQATLNGADFSLLSVLNTLAAQMSANNPADTITGTQLFARMWDAQNPAGQSANTGVAICAPNVNGFPVECRPAEGSQAAQPSTFIPQYVPIALVNRFDLRDTVGFQDCGEYRVIFGIPGNNFLKRNFIIFEAELPNPTPGVAAGCLPIQTFWKNLTAENNAATRASLLRGFYFNGLPASNVRAPIDSRNFVESTGQIRTNQFLQGGSWDLREYKVAIQNGKNTLQISTVKSNPRSSFFTDNNLDATSTAFRTDFINNMGSLLGNVATFSLNVSNNAHNNFQSHANGPLSDENAFALPAHFIPGGVFSVQISNKLSQLGSTLTTLQVVNRATAMTCGGCHMPSTFGLTNANSIGAGLSWPDSGGFVHVQENASGGVFALSPALTNVFIPARKTNMENYLNTNGTSTAAQSLAAPASAPVAVKSTKRSG